MGYAAGVSPDSYPIMLPTNTRGTPSITRKNHAMAADGGCGLSRGILSPALRQALRGTVTPAILCGLGFGE